MCIWWEWEGCFSTLQGLGLFFVGFFWLDFFVVVEFWGILLHQ